MTPSKNIFNKAEASTKLLLLNADSGDLILIKHLLNNGADINAQNKYGNTALHILSAANNIQLVDYLLQLGADFTIKNNDHYTAFDLAKLNHNLDILHSFRQASLGILEQSLLVYVSNNNLEQVKKILKKGVNINASNLEGVTSLHIAAVKGHNEILDYLIQQGANVNAVDDDNMPATHYAMIHSNDGKDHHQKSLMSLLSNGANPNIANEHDVSLLYKASYRGYVDIVNIILKQQVNVSEVFGVCNCTALHGAVMNGHQKLAFLLLANGIDITIRNIDNQSAYNIAKDQKLTHLAKHLNSLDTKLISAAANGKIELAASLLDKGADINAQGFYNENALNLATKNCHLDMISFLLAKEAKITSDIFGENALFIAARYCTPAIELLVEQGANLRAKNSFGYSAVDLLLKESPDDQVLLGNDEAMAAVI